MKKSRVLQRTGVFITITGLAILLANINTPSSTGTGPFDVPPHGTYLQVNIPLRHGPTEFRIKVPRAFEGTFYLYDYEGIRKFTKGVETPILEETIQGSTLIDFTIHRRGAYMILIQSQVSTPTGGSIGIVQKKALNQDLILDSTIIIIIGTATTTLATTPKIKQLLKHHKPTKTLQ